MYLKLALKNMKQSTKDYLIYMITLVLSVAMFYGFFSIASPYYSNMLPISIHMEILNKAMRIAVPAVGILILFLVSYVNRYMLKRKQKEFALQTIIGMEQRTVAWIFFLENVMIGAIALILGILSGTMLSQLINAAVLKAFKQEFKLYFMLFPDTVLGTVCFFGIIFFITGLKNVRIIRKMKIIDMLQNSQKGTQILNLHQQFGKFSWCVVALSVVILAMIFPNQQKTNYYNEYNDFSDCIYKENKYYSMDENWWDNHNCFGKLHDCLLVFHRQKKEENRESSITLSYNFLHVEWNILTFAEFFF